MTAPALDALLIVLAMLALLGIGCLMERLYLAWRDRNGYPKDTRPIGHGLWLERDHDFTRAHGYLEHAQQDREDAARLAAKRASLR